MHMIARMQEILYSQRTSSSAIHPIPSPLPPFPSDPPPPQKQQGTKKDRKPTGSVMILTPSHSLQHTYRQYHRCNPPPKQNKKTPFTAKQPSHQNHTASNTTAPTTQPQTWKNGKTSFKNPQDRRRGPHEHQPRIMLSGLCTTTLGLLDFHLLRRR